MEYIIRLWLAFLAGVALYMALFMFAVDKPMTGRINLDYIDFKKKYLESLGKQRKILILAGSNGRFSHRCQTIENDIHTPCVNLSITALLDLKFVFSRYEKYFNPGDILYMPLEYEAIQARSPWEAGGEAPLIVRHDRCLLAKMDPRQALSSLFYFDLRYLISGTGEMILSAAGAKRRYGIETLTLQGDESGHTIARGRPYRRHVGQIAAPLVNAEVLRNESAWGDVIWIMGQSRKRGVMVVGGLPTTFEDVFIPKGALKAISRIYINGGQYFLILGNKSLYPRSAFYDTAYHLSEEFQIRHSHLVALGLSPFLDMRKRRN